MRGPVRMVEILVGREPRIVEFPGPRDALADGLHRTIGPEAIARTVVKRGDGFAVTALTSEEMLQEMAPNLELPDGKFLFGHVLLAIERDGGQGVDFVDPNGEELATAMRVAQDCRKRGLDLDRAECYRSQNGGVALGL